jgi:DNA invertase Pin-like site-specific DNA recombinase
MNDHTGLFGALYLRISRAKGENEDTLQNHRELMEDFCREHDHTFEVYEEIVSGGAHRLEARPELQRLLDHIERYQAIFVVSLDRLSRNGLISQLIKKECTDHNVKIITPTQSFDLASSMESRLLYDVSSLYAALEYDMIGRRTKANKIQRARRGEHVSGKAPYGYRRNPQTKKLEIYETEAGVVRYIFKLYIRGFSCRQITDMLNRDGFKTQQLNDFLPSGIQLILRNPVYKGTLVFHSRRRIRENKEYRYKVLETIMTEDAHPAIIPPDEWERAHRKRVEDMGQTAFTRQKPAVKTGATMLKDLLFCGICGNKLEIQKEKNGVRIIRHCRYKWPDSGRDCNNQGVKLKLLEEEVLLELWRHQEQLVIHHLQQHQKENLLMELQERRNLIELQLRENEQVQSVLAEAAQFTSAEHEKFKIEAKLQVLLEQRPVLYESREKIRKRIRNLEAEPQRDLTEPRAALKTFKSLSAENQNATLKQFIQRIHYTRVMPEEIRKLPPRSPERQAFPFRFTIEYVQSPG